MEIKLFVHSNCPYTFAFAANSWNADFICLLLWCRCLSSCSTKYLQNCRWHVQKKMEKPISLLARISNALLSTVLSSRPVICAFAAALRMNTQTVETQLLQVPRRFNRSPCASGLNLHHDTLRKTLKTMLRTLPWCLHRYGEDFPAMQR